MKKTLSAFVFAAMVLTNTQNAFAQKPDMHPTVPRAEAAPTAEVGPADQPERMDMRPGKQKSRLFKRSKPKGMPDLGKPGFVGGEDYVLSLLRKRNQLLAHYSVWCGSSEKGHAQTNGKFVPPSTLMPADFNRFFDIGEGYTWGLDNNIDSKMWQAKVVEGCSVLKSQLVMAEGDLQRHELEKSMSPPSSVSDQKGPKPMNEVDDQPKGDPASGAPKPAGSVKNEP